MFGTVGAIAGAGMMCTYISEITARTSVTLTAGGTFLLTFIPIFAGIMALTGQITTAGTFNAVIIVASQIFSHIMLLVLTPLTSCILGVSVAGVVNPDLRVERIADIIKKTVIWVLGFMLALFTGLLTLQTFVTSAADTAGAKTARFVISSSVPLIGGAVSDALATVKGSIGLIKATTGTFGIAAGILVILPPLLSAFCYKTALGIGAGICEIFNVKELASLLKCGESVVSIILAMLFAFIVLTVISIGLMLFLTQGGAA
jgi:stage III sporulation protein AE